MTTSVPETRTIVDMQLPLTWLIGAFATVLMTMATMVWSVSGQSNKLDQLIANTAKLEKRVDDRDSRVETIKDQQYEARRQQDLLEQRVANLERGQRK